MKRQRSFRAWLQRQRLMLPLRLRRPFCRHDMVWSHGFPAEDGTYGVVRCCRLCSKRVVSYGPTN